MICSKVSFPAAPGILSSPMINVGTAVMLSFLISMAERFPLYVLVRSCLKRLFEGSAVKSGFFRKLCQHANVTDILFFLKERLKNACMVFASFPMFLCEMKAFKCQIRVRMR